MYNDDDAPSLFVLEVVIIIKQIPYLDDKSNLVRFWFLDWE